MIIPTELKDILVADPETLSGAVRFKGTRVPVQALIDTLDVGQGIEEFSETLIRPVGLLYPPPCCS